MRIFKLGKKLTSLSSMSSLTQALEELFGEIIRALNGGLEFPDIDDLGNTVRGNVSAQMVHGTWTADGAEVTLSHSLGVVATRYVSCGSSSPAVFSNGPTAPSTEATPVVARSVYDAAGTPYTQYPLEAWFMVFGSRPSQVREARFS